MATLFGGLKALPAQKLDKVFFLTAKTSGRGLALGALNALHATSSTPLRALELVARDKSCEHPDKACHGASCPLSCQQVPATPAFTPCPRSIQVGEFEVATGGGI